MKRSGKVGTALAFFVALLPAVVGPIGCGPPQAVTVRVLTYNIHHGEGVDGRVDLERIAGVIRRAEADLVALQEVDRGVGRSGRVDQPARLAALTGMQVVFEKNIDVQGGAYGNAVLSRFPVERYRNHHLPRIPPNEQRGLLKVHVQHGEYEIVFLATHLDHQVDDGERVACVKVIGDLVAQWTGRPVIVAGDFNDRPVSRVMADASVFLQDIAGQGGGSEPTYPAPEPTRRIDYVLHNRHPALKCVEHRVLPEPVASDHRPVLAVFEIRSARWP